MNIIYQNDAHNVSFSKMIAYRSLERSLEVTRGFNINAGCKFFWVNSSNLVKNCFLFIFLLIKNLKFKLNFSIYAQ